MGVNKIIVLSHSGYSVDKRVARETTGVDVIVGGHTNTYLSNTSDRAVGPYPTMVGDTAIVSAYAYGKFLGELRVTFNDAGEIISAAGEPLIMDAAVAEHEGTKARVAEAAKPLDEIRNRVVGTAASEIPGGGRCRMMECAMGNLIADAMLDRVRDQGIEIAIQNGGGIRASIDAGEITMGEVLTVLFQNTLSTFCFGRRHSRGRLRTGYHRWKKAAGAFPQVAGSLCSAQAGCGGEAIADVKVSGVALDRQNLRRGFK